MPLQAGKQLNNDLVLQGKFGSSDHVPFAEAGIPLCSIYLDGCR